MDIPEFIRLALEEDVKDGDHTSLACISASQTGKAILLVKEEGVLAGVELAEMIFSEVSPDIQLTPFLTDGSRIKKGDIAFTVSGPEQFILKAERLVLNCMQRMSGIATLTSRYVEKINDLPVKILDTRKTTPLFRHFEKWAVRIGGGFNHRMGLFDMIMIKDNHIDYAGGIEKAIRSVHQYLAEKKMELPVEVETRNLDEVQKVIATGGVTRIMLDNFSPENLKTAVHLIDKRMETEASGGITLDSVRSYALTGVDFISVGALTHSVKSLDLSLKSN